MEPDSRTSKVFRFETLKTRAEFQRVRGGGRATAAGFILEGKLRPQPDRKLNKPERNHSKSKPSDPLPGNHPPLMPAGPSLGGPRFGFTITKKIGNAVVRNKIRRRLRAALVEISPLVARPGTDYVLVARLPAAGQKFATLVDDLKTAFARVHAPASTKPAAKTPNARPADKKGVTEGSSRPSPLSATSTQQLKSSRD